LFGLSEPDARTRLLTKVRQAMAGTARPDVRPEFPGASRAMPHSQEQGWLLIFDNAEKVEDIIPWLPMYPGLPYSTDFPR